VTADRWPLLDALDELLGPRLGGGELDGGAAHYQCSKARRCCSAASGAGLS
jgi:hypothetical protein